jgi:hypothetical protein
MYTPPVCVAVPHRTPIEAPFDPTRNIVIAGAAADDAMIPTNGVGGIRSDGTLLQIVLSVPTAPQFVDGVTRPRTVT